MTRDKQLEQNIRKPSSVSVCSGYTLLVAVLLQVATNQALLLFRSPALNRGAFASLAEEKKENAQAA